MKFKIDCKIIPVTLHVVTTQQEYIDIVSKYEDVEEDNTVLGLMHVVGPKDGRYKFVMFIDEKAKDIERIIVHETIHATWFILDHLGIDITSYNHEIQCYLAEYLAGECFKRVVN